MPVFKHFLLVLFYLLQANSLKVRQQSVFLQTSNYEKTQSTSLGTLADGIDKLNQDLSDLAEQLDESLKALNDQVKNSIDISDDYSTALITANINDIKRQLDVLDKQIAQLEAEYTTIQYCQDKLSCGLCTERTDCVWCSEEKTCISGDESGPSGEGCFDYSYGQCDNTGCDIYQSCDNCIADPLCGWCENGDFCVSGTEDGSDQCKAEFYIHKDGSNSICPAIDNSGSDTDLYVNTNNLEEKDEEDYQADLDVLYGIKEDLEKQLEQLEDALDEINDEARKAENRDMEDISVENQLGGIGDMVDGQYEDEMEESKDYQWELVEESSEETIDQVNEQVVESTDSVDENINESYSAIQERLDDVERELNSEIDALENDINSLQSEVDASAAQSNTTTTDTTATDGTTGDTTTETSTDGSEAGTTDTSTETTESSDTASSETAEPSSFMQIYSLLFGK